MKIRRHKSKGLSLAHSFMIMTNKWWLFAKGGVDIRAFTGPNSDWFHIWITDTLSQIKKTTCKDYFEKSVVNESDVNRQNQYPTNHYPFFDKIGNNYIHTSGTWHNTKKICRGEILITSIHDMIAPASKPRYCLGGLTRLVLLYLSLLTIKRSADVKKNQDLNNRNTPAKYATKQLNGNRGQWVATTVRGGIMLTVWAWIQPPIKPSTNMTYHGIV